MTSVLRVNNIQASTGNSAMSIDSNGNTTISQKLSTPARPAFLAYDSSSGWRDYTAHGGAVDMVWGATRFNIGSHFDTSNGKFTCPIAGIYYFHCWAYVSTAVHKNYLYLQKNGSAVQSVLADNHDENVTIQISGLVQCSVNDLIHMKYQCNIDATGNVYSGGNEQWSGFEGYLIG